MFSSFCTKYKLSSVFGFKRTYRNNFWIIDIAYFYYFQLHIKLSLYDEVFFNFSDKKGGKIVFGDLILVSCNIKKSSTRIDYKLCQTRVPTNSHQKTSSAKHLIELLDFLSGLYLAWWIQRGFMGPLASRPSPPPLSF